MTNLTLHIENNATLDAILPLLKHLGITYSSNEMQIAEPTVAYQAVPQKRKLVDALLSKKENIDREQVLQSILETTYPIVNLEERLEHLKECRTDRPLPLREEI